MKPPSDRLKALSRITPARVRLDVDASPLPLSSLLAFQEDHAAARDAIFAPMDWEVVKAALGEQAQLVRSHAHDRATYLRRPDLGRRLAEGAAIPETEPALAIVIADGLSPPAVMRHAAPLVKAMRKINRHAREAPVFLAEQGRVAIGDDIGLRCGAQMVLVLIGERPGLTVSDSLGAYLTWAPKIPTLDGARNCVSNIHGRGGLSHDAAAARLVWLMEKAIELRATGTVLKDTSPSGGDLLPPASAPGL